MLTIVGLYMTELRDYPRITAGWLMLLTTPAMASTTFLTTWFHRRRLRHVWLIVGVVGTAACTWWLSMMDNFTPKEHIALNLACWGAFLGLLPPAFLCDEVEALNPKDALYALTLSIVGLITPIITVPTMTGTIIKAWSDRALDTYRLNLSVNRPAVPAGCGSRRRVLPAAWTEWPGRSTRDQHGPGHLRHARKRRGGFPVGSALPEPDDADPRADGRAAAVACGPGFECAARGWLYVTLRQIVLAAHRRTQGYPPTLSRRRSSIVTTATRR